MPPETLHPASGPAVWYGPAMAQQSDWLHQLGPDQIDALEEMQYYDMIVCDLEGYKTDGPAKSTQCSEVKIHSCIYRERPDVMSVVHVHPRYTVLMTVLEERLRPMAQEGAQLVKSELPVYPHTKTVWSEEEGAELVTYLGDGKAVLMRGHGAAMTGKTVEDSVLSMLQLEEQARMNYWAQMARWSFFGCSSPRGITNRLSGDWFSSLTLNLVIYTDHLSPQENPLY